MQHDHRIAGSGLHRLLQNCQALRYVQTIRKGDIMPLLFLLAAVYIQLYLPICKRSVKKQTSDNKTAALAEKSRATAVPRFGRAFN